LPDGRIAVRNSNHPDDGLVLVTRAEMNAWINGVKAGEFDKLIDNDNGQEPGRTVGLGQSGRAPKGDSVLKGVLDLLAGLLHLALDFVGLALGFEMLVAGSPTNGCLHLALQFLGHVRDLVCDTHRALLRRLLAN
jgi:hypothetical protein